MIMLLLKKYWFHAAVVAAVLYFGVVAYGKIYDSGYSEAEAKWQKLWDAQALELANDKAEAEKAQRELEREWQSKINEAQTDAELKIKALKDDLAAASDSAASLHEYAREMAKRAGRSCQSAGTGTGSETTDTTAMVLADVLGRVENAGRELAESFDRSRVAGLACEQAYDSLINKKPAN